ncbi:DNA cytosine methyltransferase [Microcoleus sp. FACHB-672]|uniref:DNA cytosine methyltransferase n=1 Tax=Microcoleus sp. FACHB-672 TaxID=2692825 RepID=UPI002815991E|nr:DNA cytosine methyltransferase [Microcoleus sp. FACHB-672]
MTKILKPKSQYHSDRRPLAVDLFAGAGGFSLAVEQAGFDVLTAVEVDSVHAAVYTFNFPYTEVLCADISTLSSLVIADTAAQSWTSLPVAANQRQSSAWDGEIDLVIGGPPSQGFAIMGKGVIEDERNDFVFEFARVVCELQPRYFIMENVPSLVTDQYTDFLERLISQLEAAGYKITLPVQVLNAADFGVPQDRQRMFLLGSRCGQVLLPYPEPLIDRKVTVRDAIADLPDVDEFPELLDTDELLLPEAQLKALEDGASEYVRSLRGLVRDRADCAYHRLWNRQLITGCLRTAHTPDCVQRFKDTPMGKVENNSRLRRLDMEGLCSPLRAGTGREGGRHTSPRPIHPLHPRVITVREAARLHSFPDWFRFHTTKWHGFRQVGNALPPLLGRAVAGEVIKALEVELQVPDVPVDLGNPDLLRMSPSLANHYWEAHLLKTM